MIALADVNSCYTACESVFEPAIRNKPIITLSNNDGCIVALNRRAKEAGVPKFEPYFKIKPICDHHDIIVRSSNYELYGDLSAKLMQVIAGFGGTKRHYVYSIDEIFLELMDGLKNRQDLMEYGTLLRRTVWKQTRLPISIGIGPTLTLAKAGSHAAKKLPGYNGVATLTTQQEWEPVLAQMQTSDIWGIGSRISKRLALMNIDNALQLSRMPPSEAKRNFSIEVERTVRELNGEKVKQWDNVRADKQQIFSTRSVGERITKREDLRQAICQHASTVARKARSQGSLAVHMLVFATSSPYDKHPASFRFSHTFSTPTNDSRLITSAAANGLVRLFKPGVAYYRVGVGLLEMTPARNRQLSLLEKDKSSPALMKVMDEINAKYGNGTAILAAQGIQQKWQMRRDFLSPQYTTRWSDIPTIYCK